MPFKGSKSVERKPHEYRSRNDGLALHIQQQLIIDIETFGAEAEITNKRSSLYGEPASQLNRAVRNRKYKLLKLKHEDPKEYW